MSETGGTRSQFELSLLADDGRIAFRTAAVRVGVVACRGADSRAKPELLIVANSGGARCCNTFRVLSLSGPVKVLLRWDAGYADDLEFTAADRLAGSDDRLRGFGDLPLAFSPLLPVAFCREGENRRYRDCSNERIAREMLLEQLGRDVEQLRTENHPARRKGEGLRIAAMARRAKGLDRVMEWLRQGAPDVAEWLMGHKRKLDACLKIPATRSREARLKACQ